MSEQRQKAEREGREEKGDREDQKERTSPKEHSITTRRPVQAAVPDDNDDDV